MAINATSIAGGCSSVILKSYRKVKENCRQPDEDLPRFITLSSINEVAVTAILDEISKLFRRLQEESH